VVTGSGLFTFSAYPIGTMGARVPVIDGLKKCTSCGQEKLATSANFYRQRGTFRATCIPCIREYNSSEYVRTLERIRRKTLTKVNPALRRRKKFLDLLTSTLSFEGAPAGTTDGSLRGGEDSFTSR
jgi:hypothetical protein